MNILQVNNYDSIGGAARISEQLWRAYLDRGHGSWLAVAHKNLVDATVYEIPRRDITLWGRGWWWLYAKLDAWALKNGAVAKLQRSASTLARGRMGMMEALGLEYCDQPGSWMLLDVAPVFPDILQLHNLHGNYFDLRALPALSNRIPTVITLHDEWMFTGHCAYTFDCVRWMGGCGNCPDLMQYPSLERDGTACNWRWKRHIFRASKLHIATPSRWLMSKVECSMLGYLDARVIHNGVDFAVFRPGNQHCARRELGLRTDGNILLFLAYGGTKNPFKDYATLEEAVRILGASGAFERPTTLLIVGGQSSYEERYGELVVKYLPFNANPSQIARYYQASDIYFHLCRSDNFPTTVMEALACGVPVIGSAVGGVPEQLMDGKNGFLVPPRDAKFLVEKTLFLLENKEARKAMSQVAASDARERFNIERQADQYISWYEELLAGWRVAQ
ncbi:MAG: glycosyltransferase [Anaerolineales bacterium]|nr:glycosyltransferase [Anaerolineales bacterium]